MEQPLFKINKYLFIYDLSESTLLVSRKHSKVKVRKMCLVPFRHWKVDQKNYVMFRRNLNFFFIENKMWQGTQTEMLHKQKYTCKGIYIHSALFKLAEIICKPY